MKIRQLVDDICVVVPFQASGINNIGQQLFADDLFQQLMAAYQIIIGRPG